MEAEDALAGEYVIVMLAVVAMWVALLIVGMSIGGYLALSKLGH